ncbi:MAG TPA: FliM/FliN family flagellar motor C-terminal domain-containing protein [Allosphingosinicella sp.]
MSISHRAWLPREALVGPEFRSAVAETVRAWSAAWFPALRLEAREIEPGGRAWTDEGTALRWLGYAESVAIAATPVSAASLVARALDSGPGQKAETDRDRALLKGLEHGMFADLAARLSEALGAEARRRPADVKEVWPAPEGATVRVVDDKGEAFRLAVGLGELVAFRKSRIAKAPSPRQPLMARSSSLRPVRVDVEARLGKAQVPLSDLRGLVPGDVLILDRTLAEPADLSLAGSDRVFARARLAERADSMSLTLES